MNAPPIDWISAIAVLVAGLVLGVLFFYFNKRKAQTLGGEADLERKDLEAKRDALVQQTRPSAPTSARAWRSKPRKRSASSTRTTTACRPERSFGPPPRRP